jgi:CrcB protein
MKMLMFVFIGGGLGSVSRYLINLFFASRDITLLPAGTLTANVISSFILGILLAAGTYRSELSDEVKMLLVVGFCGGFSTFSTFTAENLQLIKDGQYMMTAMNMILNVSLCLFIMIAGVLLGRTLLGR